MRHMPSARCTKREAGAGANPVRRERVNREYVARAWALGCAHKTTNKKPIKHASRDADRSNGNPRRARATPSRRAHAHRTSPSLSHALSLSLSLVRWPHRQCACVARQSLVTRRVRRYHLSRRQQPNTTTQRQQQRACRPGQPSPHPSPHQTTPPAASIFLLRSAVVSVTRLYRSSSCFICCRFARMSSRRFSKSMRSSSLETRPRCCRRAAFSPRSASRSCLTCPEVRT